MNRLEEDEEVMGIPRDSINVMSFCTCSSFLSSSIVFSLSHFLLTQKMKRNVQVAAPASAAGRPVSQLARFLQNRRVSFYYYLFLSFLLKRMIFFIYLFIY